MVHAQASILILGAGSLFIFDRMKFDMAWLSKPINDWEFDSGFQELKAFVFSLTSVNDSAERSVKLISDFCGIITKSSKSRRELLEVVEKNRNQYSDFRKVTLNQ